MLTLLQWGLGIGGLLVLAIGLFWDRPGWRGRAALRCRKCWFDLTGAAGLDDVSKDAPVQCPECGTSHAAKRAMRRTRRRRRLIGIAAVMLFAWYAVPVIPAVRDRGWIAAVPGFALVATLPFFTEAETTSDAFLPNMMFARSNPGYNAYAGWDATVFEELTQRLKTWEGHANLGWPTRRLVFLLGRLEDTETLVDPLTLKGFAYRSLVAKFFRDDQVFGFEQAWARRQVVVEFEPHLPAYRGASLYGTPRLRFLTGEPGILSAGWRRYGFTQSGSLYGPVAHSGQIQKPEMYRERNRYDRVWPVDEDGERLAYWSRDEQRRTYNMMCEIGDIDPSWSSSTPVEFVGSVQWGKDERERREIRNVSTRLTKDVFLDPMSVLDFPSITTDPAMKALLENRIGVQPILIRDTQNGEFRPAFKLVRRNWGGPNRLDKDVIFGGSLEFYSKPPSSSQTYFPQLCRASIFEHYWMIENDEDFEASRQWGREIDAGVYRRELALIAQVPQEFSKTPHDHTRVVVKITNYITRKQQPMRHQDLSGHTGDLIFSGELELVMPRWTPFEFKRFLMTGYIPDHAME